MWIGMHKYKNILHYIVYKLEFNYLTLKSVVHQKITFWDAEVYN